MRSLTHVFLAAGVLAASASAQIEVYHQTVNVEKGTSYQFSSYVPLSPSSVTWSVNGILGGNSTVGTITQAGFYTAPAAIPMSNVVSVKATSTAFPNIRDRKSVV